MNTAILKDAGHTDRPLYPPGSAECPKNRKLETNIGKLFSLLADGFEVIHKNAELVRLWDDLEMPRAQCLTVTEPTLVYSAVQQAMPSTEF